ncbi:hypothetical protein KBTX_02433 [wastewater metagenome]|uniref:TRAP C4-dicarboxylate transport system permease DctM subunit domain-containing protein n=4 Tax=root TaxID=1 RepID=A0A5B8RF11_9ZZZZ|nr:hypothetical protein KBTEX_02433 [uncultured organism]
MTANDDGRHAPESGRWRRLLTPPALLALAWAAFQVAIYVWPDMDLMVRRSGHVAFATSLAFLLAPDGGRAWRLWLNRAFAALALTPPVYLALELERIYQRIVQLDPVLTGDRIFACLAVVLLLEALRRRAGAGMFALGVGFIAYQLLGAYIPGIIGHNISGFDTFVELLLLTERGLFGIPTAVSAEIVFYFILFAAVFDAYGGGQLIIDLAMRVTGRQTGGPAKASVVASALTGSVSGSAVANVMSTGIFTIPLMRRVGYPATFAAGVEAVASTGGQILPPVMGAGAFIMANFLQIPYQDVVLAAILPALAFFASLLLVVHFRARRDGIRPLGADELGDWRGALKARWHLLVPLVWLATAIVSGLSVADAAVQSCALTVVVGSLRRSTRQRPIELLEALVRTGERALSVALPCAVASIIVAVIAFTGLGTKFTALVVHLSEGNLYLALGLTALASLVLGAGMPTTSAYVMAAVLVAPALVQLDVAPLVAHLFVFYVSIISMVTPPVALAAYAASTVAGSKPGETGWAAFYLALPGLVIPFAFALHPALVLWDGAGATAWAVARVALACSAFAVLLPGWLGRRLRPLERLVLGVGAVLSLLPATVPAIVGLVLLVAQVVALRLLPSPPPAAEDTAGG